MRAGILSTQEQAPAGAVQEVVGGGSAQHGLWGWRVAGGRSELQAALAAQRL